MKYVNKTFINSVLRFSVSEKPNLGLRTILILNNVKSPRVVDLKDRFLSLKPINCKSYEILKFSRSRTLSILSVFSQLLNNFNW